MEGLKDFRAKNYGESIADDKDDKEMDKDKDNSTSRIIKLSDDEQKYFQASHPGENLTCTVTGTLEKDGHFHVMTVSAEGGEQNGEDKMASMVAQRVMPMAQISPS